jgi:hypothetical protein
MFITKTMNESAGLDVPNMSLDQYMVESACEAYEDLINLNEALAHFDIKEQELICTESVELDAFREEAMDKAKAFLKDLVAKVKAKWNQFINFVLKKLATSMAERHKKAEENLKTVGKSDIVAFINNSDAKIKFREKINSVAKVVEDLVDFGDASFKRIGGSTLEQLSEFKPSDSFAEQFGKVVAKSVKGEEVFKAYETTNNAAAVIKKFQKTLENAIENAGKAASGDEKEAARKVTLINLKGQQVIKLILTDLISVAGSAMYILGISAYKVAKQKTGK